MKVFKTLLLFLSVLLMGLMSIIAYTDDCYDTAITQYEITMCSKAKASASEDRLEKLLGVLFDTLKPEQRNLLERSQEGWEIMLDGDCAIEKSFYGGGSAGSSAYNACISSHQIERIEQIKYYLCPDYSMKGDCPAATEF